MFIIDTYISNKFRNTIKAFKIQYKGRKNNFSSGFPLSPVLGYKIAKYWARCLSDLRDEHILRGDEHLSLLLVTTITNLLNVTTSLFSSGH